MKRMLEIAVTLAVVVPGSLAAQNRVVTGTVRDRGTGLVVPGAEVRVTGWQTAVCANPRGEYRLVVPTGPASLSARAAGFGSVTLVAASGDSVVSLDLDRIAALAGPLIYLDGRQVGGSDPAVEPGTAASVAPNAPLMYIDGIRVSGTDGCSQRAGAS